MSKLIKKNDIFGVTGTSLSGIKGMELRYKAENHETSNPNYLRQSILRDKNGNYFLHIKCGGRARIGTGNSFPIDGKEVLIPIAREALYDWAEFNLAGEEYASALEEFKRSDTFRHKKVWQYQNEVKMGQPGHVYEFLLKTDVNGYILFSTDCSYPYFAHNTTWVDLNEDDSSDIRDDLYMYYVTPETARRWAEARGMDEHTCRTVFGQ